MMELRYPLVAVICFLHLIHFMNFISGHTYHIYNQGNNRELIFKDRSDYIVFLKKIRRAFNQHCDILSWCLMPNHFHFLVQVRQEYEMNYPENDRTKKLNPLNKSIGTALSSYTQNFNKKTGRTGSLFRKRTKAKSLSFQRGEDNHGINCYLYIHQNPIRAGLVKKLEDWEFSSFRDYAGLRKGNSCNKKLATELFNLPASSSEFYELSYRTIPESVVKSIH